MGLLSDFLANVASVLVTPRSTPLKAATHHKPLLDELAAGVLWRDQGHISTGNVISLANPVVELYPAHDDAGLTGNISFSATNAVVGGRALVKHSDLVSPSTPAEILNPTAFLYSEGQDNYFEFECLKTSPLQVWVTKRNPDYAASVHTHSRIQNAANTTYAQATVGGNLEIKTTASALIDSRNVAIGHITGVGNDTQILVLDPDDEIQLITQNLVLPQYTSSRDDGPTTKALFTDSGGGLRLGTVATSGAANAYHHPALANVAALQDLDTSNATDYPSGGELTVVDAGEYWIKRGDATAESLPTVVVDAAGNRWFQRTGTGVTGTINLNDITDVTAPTPATDDVLKWNGTAWINGAPSGANAYHHPALANVEALQALVSTSIPDLAVVFIAGEGQFAKDPAELGPEDLAAGIVEDASGNFWKQFTGYPIEEVGATYGDIWIDAGYMTPATTNGATISDVDYPTVEKTVSMASFSNSTEQGAVIAIALPIDYEDGSTIKAKFHWDSASGGSGSIGWGIKAVALGDGEDYETAWGTEITVSDALSSVGNNHISPATAAVTIGNTPVSGQLVLFKVSGKTSPNLGVNALLRGVHIQYTKSATPVAQW